MCAGIGHVGQLGIVWVEHISVSSELPSAGSWLAPCLPGMKFLDFWRVAPGPQLVEHEDQNVRAPVPQLDEQEDQGVQSIHVAGTERTICSELFSAKK